MTTYTFSPIDDPLGTVGTRAFGINGAGQIVGTYFDSSGAQHGFLYNSSTFNYTTIDAARSTTGAHRGN